MLARLVPGPVVLFHQPGLTQVGHLWVVKTLGQKWQKMLMAFASITGCHILPQGQRDVDSLLGFVLVNELRPTWQNWTLPARWPVQGGFSNPSQKHEASSAAPEPSLPCPVVLTSITCTLKVLFTRNSSQSRDQLDPQTYLSNYSMSFLPWDAELVMGGTVTVLFITVTSGPSRVWKVEVAYLMNQCLLNKWMPRLYLPPAPVQFVSPARATILSGAQYNTVVENLSSGARLPGFEPRLC